MFQIKNGENLLNSLANVKKYHATIDNIARSHQLHWVIHVT